MVAGPDAVEAATAEPEPPAPELSETERELVDLAVDGDAGELRRLVEMRVPELTAYQSAAYARRYAEAVRRVQVAEQERVPGHGELAEAVARNLFKLMAYKDEYEVARLHLDSVERAQARPRARRGRTHLVQPPPAAAARAGPQAQAQARALVRAGVPRPARHAPAARHAARPVRPGAGAPRRAPARGRVRGAGGEALDGLTPDTHATAVELCELPDMVRGYEDIKLESVERFRERAQELREELRSSDASATPA